MNSIKVTKARKEFFKLIEEIGESHEPVKIVGKNNTVVMISEEDWKAIEETNYLNSIPGMADSIIKSIEEGTEGASDTIEW